MKPCDCPQDERFTFATQRHTLACSEKRRMSARLRHLLVNEDERGLRDWFDPQVDDRECIPDGVAQMSRPYRDLDEVDDPAYGPPSLTMVMREFEEDYANG